MSRELTWCRQTQVGDPIRGQAISNNHAHCIMAAVPTHETPISWSNSFMSKIYPADISSQDGSNLEHCLLLIGEYPFKRLLKVDSNIVKERLSLQICGHHCVWHITGKAMKEVTWLWLGYVSEHWQAQWWPTPGPLFTKWKDVLPPSLTKSRNREIGCYNDHNALKFERHFGSAVADVSQISEWLENSKLESRGFGTSRDLTIRRLPAKE